MRRALKRAAQAFVAAGALGLVSPALAQSAHAFVQGQSAATAKKAEAAKPAETPQTAATALDEMQVELAWLANKTTFAHSLTAHVVDSTLEVHGFAPNAMVKEQAVAIAQRHTTLPVVDKVKVNASVRVPIGGAPPDELIEKANQVLADNLGDLAQDLEVTARETGVVVIKGSVHSVEDKLAISRKMRGVEGCAAVVNQIAVVKVLRDGHMVTQVSADGSLVFSDEPRPMPPPPVVVTPPPAKPVVVAPPLITPPVVVKPTTPATTTPTTPQYSSGAISTAPPTPVVVPQLASSSSAWSDKPVVTPKEANPGDFKPVVSDKPPIAPPAMPWTPSPAPSKPAPVVAVVTPKPADSGIWPAAHSEKPVQVAYVTTGTVSFDDDVTLPAPLPKATQTPPSPYVQPPAQVPFTPGPTVKPAPMPGVAPVVTPSTTPVFNKPVTAPAPMPGVAPTLTTTSTPPVFAPTPTSAASKLKDKIEAICGKQAKVAVTTKPDKSLKVLVQVGDSKTEMALLDKIMQVPEFATPNVHLEMEVMSK